MDIHKLVVRKIIDFAFYKSKKNNQNRCKRRIDRVVIYYRICDKGYPKVKPNYITKENCLKNALKVFPLNKVDWHIYGYNISDETYKMLQKYVPDSVIERVSIGHGAGTFRLVYEEAINNNTDDTLCYFLEDDYLHIEGALDYLTEAAEENYADYITLYDCPDKYGYKNNNPFIKDGGEDTKVFLSSNRHWKLTNSTTMTMAAYTNVLKRDKTIWWRWTESKHPYDFHIFIDLKLFSKAKLISPIPSISTHGETAFLAPLVDWENI